MLVLLNCATGTDAHVPVLTNDTLHKLFTVKELPEWSNKSESIGKYSIVFAHGCYHHGVAPHGTVKYKLLESYVPKFA